MLSTATYTRRLVIVVSALVLAGLVLWLSLTLLERGLGRGYEADFVQNTWLGGHLVLSGDSPYDPAAWQAAKDAFLPRPDVFPYYIYPIWVPILAAPFALLSPLQALAAWTTLNLLFLLLSLKLVYRLAQRRLPAMEAIVLLLLSLLFVPTWHLLLEGQINMLLLLILLASMAGMQARSFWLNGALLSLALAKPQSSWLLVGAILWWLLVRRCWSEIIGFVGGSLLLWLGPLILYPDWWSRWLAITRVQSVYLMEITPSVWGLAFQWVPGHARAVALGVSLVVLGITAWWWFRRVSMPGTELWETAPLSIVGLVISLYGLLYEQVLLLFPFWLCWQWANTRAWRWLLIGWSILLPLGALALLAANPPHGLIFAIALPLTLLPIYFYLKPDRPE